MEPGIADDHQLLLRPSRKPLRDVRPCVTMTFGCAVPVCKLQIEVSGRLLHSAYKEQTQRQDQHHNCSAPAPETYIHMAESLHNNCINGANYRCEMIGV